MQNEVIEKKEKKPLGKKRIVAIVAIALVAVLLLIPVVSQCVIELFNGKVYEQDGHLFSPRVYVENIYVEDGVVHYTIVNKTIQELSCTSGWQVEKYVDGEWVKCEFPGPGLPPLGEKRKQGDPRSIPPKVSAFDKIELTNKLPDYIIQSEGEYRFCFFGGLNYSITTEIMDCFVPIIYKSKKPYCVYVYFSLPAAS